MDKEIIANIKALGIDMINEAKSGHPGIVLGAAPIIYTVFAKYMNISTNDPYWINRDRFIMSAGHGSALLYATLFMAGYNYTIDDLRNFRKLGSKTPGHPEYNVKLGIEASSGPLGQGFATAVGMALGRKILSNKFKFPKVSKFEKERSLFDYRIYVLCGDGDLMEGISYEAASLAGTLNLDNLVVLYDSNSISLDGDTSNTFTENVLESFKAMGWHTDLVKDGNNVNDIDKAIGRANSSGKPAIIEVRTIIGKDSINEGTSKVHGSPLSEEDINQIKVKLGISEEPFYVNERLKSALSDEIMDRSNRKYDKWSKTYSDYVLHVLENDTTSLRFLFKEDNIPDLSKQIWDIDFDKPESLRNLNSYVMNKLAPTIPNFIGGSADLSSSTKTYLTNYSDIKDGKYNGRNIWFGVREHAMGAILNGLSLTRFKTFGSTFLTFSDYLKPSIRMSALMTQPVTYIFTHDSINIGADGPTHQPIEQLAMLRSIPNLNVYRPCDLKEIIGSWNAILHTKVPSALIIGRNEVNNLNSSDMNGVLKGAYIIRKETEKLMGIIIATGTEVHTAIRVANELYKKNHIDLRVVSMPCMELFELQNDDYKKSIIPSGLKTFVIEAGSSFGWEKYVYNNKYLITLNNFGKSGSSNEVLEHFEYTHKQITERILELFI